MHAVILSINGICEIAKVMGFRRMNKSEEEIYVSEMRDVHAQLVKPE